MKQILIVACRFDNYDQSVCVDAQNCQQRLVNNQGANNQLYMFNLITM